MEVKIPSCAKPAHDIVARLVSHLPPRGEACSLIEIGCAPGRWMAFFSKQFGYRVSGVEYAAEAAANTRRNLDFQGVSADLFIEDFLLWDLPACGYDLVFSAGFIEHFPDLPPVVERLSRLSRRFVVTLVPNLHGVNGFIRKTFNPVGFSEHVPIDISTLVSLHEACQLKTLFCGYVGGIQFVPPGDGSLFYRKHRNCAKIIYGPIIMLNRFSMWLSRLLKRTSNSKWLSNNLMYIGVKPADWVSGKDEDPSGKKR